MMDKSDTIDALATALGNAQSAMPAIPKRGRGQVGQQQTTYATFDDLVATVRGPLAEHGLSFVQMLDDGPSLTTVLMHTSGQWIASSTPIEAMEPNKGTNAMQAYGSTLTYLKRYALASLLGVASDDDDDGSTSQHRPVVRRAPAAQSGPPEPPPDAWDEEAAGNGSEPYLDVSEVGVFLTKAGKPHIGLMEDGHKWPDIRWWKGRDELLTAAPWLGETVTKEQLGTPDARFPFAARVYYSEDDKGYKAAERFERI
jgi:hypothetical protein